MTTPRLLPLLPGMIEGIVAVETTESGRKVYTLQCQHCGATEQPWPLVLMRFKFCPRYDKAHGKRRLCPDCRTKSLTGQGYSEREAHSIITEGYLR